MLVYAELVLCCHHFTWASLGDVMEMSSYLDHLRHTNSKLEEANLQEITYGQPPLKSALHREADSSMF